MTRTCEAVARHLGVPRAMGSRWAAELGWSPGQGNTHTATLTVGRIVGLEVYGTLARQHRDRHHWQYLARTVAQLVDRDKPVRWVVHAPDCGPQHMGLYYDSEPDSLAASIDSHTRDGHQVIVVDIHQLAARWADSPPCPPPKSPPSPSSPPSSPPPSSRS